MSRAGTHHGIYRRALARRDRNWRPELRQLLAESLEKRILLTTILNVVPPASSHNASAATDITATFDQDVVAGTATPQNFIVHGTMSRGQLGGAATSVSASGPVITHNPTSNFAAGEVVQVTATSDISTTSGAANKRVWQFRTQSAGSAVFVDGGAGLGNNAYEHVSLGDVDGDSDLDAVLGGSELWLNDGSGGFTYGQNLGVHLYSFGLEFADIDADGDLDLTAGARVMVNNGSGVFTNTGVDLGGGAAVPGDLDGDGDMDIMTARAYDTNRVLFNDGSGNFTDSGQALASNSTDAVILGDLDNDGDLDAFEVNQGPPNRVFVNDGSGNFTDSGQALGGFRAGKDADIGDVDSDGDLDVVVANVYNNTGARIYLNDGNGTFFESGQSIGGATGNLYRVRLADFDGDGDLDIFAPQRSSPGSEVWLNDGSGTFSDTGQRLFFSGPRRIDGADVGDLDGDGDLDIIEVLAASVGGARVWFNQSLEPNVTLSVDTTTLTENPGSATITATLSAAHTQPVTVDLGFSGSATLDTDYTVSGAQISIDVGATTGSITVTAVQDTADDDDETVVVDITNITNGQAGGTQQVVLTIIDDDEPVMPEVTLVAAPEEIPEASGVSTFTASLSEVTTVDVTVDLAVAVSSTASQATDYDLSGLEITIAPGSSSGSVTVTAIQDDIREPDETVTLEIASVTGGNEAGQQEATVSIVDDDVPPTFRVSQVTPRSTGFTATLSAEVNASVLNLFDTETGGNGPADVTLEGATIGPVDGSLVVDSSGRTLSFITTGDRLAADTYTVTMRSGENGLKDTADNLLDGDSDGTAGGDFIESFTIAPGTATELALPDFVRGPGQPVEVPHGSAGLPLTISDGAAVRRATLSLDFNPDLLNITGATIGTDMPTGATVDVDTSSTGQVVISFTSPSDLPAGSNTLVELQASVPTGDASAIYRAQHVLDISGISLANGAGDPIPSVDNDAIHVAAFMADVSGNGQINATDASQTARVAAFLDSGLFSFLTVDPQVIADVTGNGVINAADASQVARVAALIPVPGIPPIPPGVVIAAGEGRTAAHSRPARPSVDSTVLLYPTPHLVASTGHPDFPVSTGLPLAIWESAVVSPVVDMPMMHPTDRAIREMRITNEDFPLALEVAVEELLFESQGRLLE